MRFARRYRAPRGMTVLELMIVIAIIGAGVALLGTAFRALTKADLVDNATELSAVLRRTSQLAIELGEVHRVVIDLDRPDPGTPEAAAEGRLDYQVEVCRGQVAIARNEAVRPDAEATKRAIERGQARLGQLPTE